VDIDLGPTQIVAGTGGGRASGGGQPTMNFSAQTGQVARRGSAGAPSVSVAANVVAESPRAPVGSGGGSPPTIQANIEATSFARGSTGGELPTAGGPSSVQETGEVAVVSTAAMVGEAVIGRAEVVEAQPGPAVAGGGTGSPARAASGHAFTANTRAETVSIAGSPDSGGAPEGASIEAQGTEHARASVGVLAPTGHDDVGAAAGDVIVDAPLVAEPGAVTGTRRTSPSAEDGPIVADISSDGAPLRRATTTGLPTGTIAEVEVPVAGAASPVAVPDAEALAGGMGDTGVGRQAAGALPVHVAAVEGPGGLGTELTPNVGINRVRAQTESEEIHLRTARFVRRTAGGVPGIDVTAAPVGTEAFSRRSLRQGDDTGGGAGRPLPRTEEAIELGLHFLARHQLPDGSWTLNDFGVNQPEEVKEEYVDERAAIRSDVAATAMALLAFQGAGYQHKEGKYVEIVNAALTYLIKNQKKNGDLYLPQDDESNRSAWLYSHSIATIALCEAYGMTQDPELHEPAQKALDFIIKSQQGDRGGWRYSPGYGADTSVTGWMMMALKSGQLSNLDVPDEVFDKIEKWLDRAQASKKERHLYSYNPYAPDTDKQRHGRQPTMTMTSVGLLMRLYTGWQRDNKYMKEGADYLLENLPEIGSRRDPKRDTYYWYYATQVMFHMKGEYWEKWNKRLHPMLTESQIKQGTFTGSWDPRRPVPDRWGPHAGRMYVTCMNLLSLEVYYRHLPIYEDVAK